MRPITLSVTHLLSLDKLLSSVPQPHPHSLQDTHRSAFWAVVRLNSFMSVECLEFLHGRH